MHKKKKNVCPDFTFWPTTRHNIRNTLPLARLFPSLREPTHPLNVIPISKSQAPKVPGERKISSDMGERGAAICMNVKKKTRCKEIKVKG